MVDIPTVNDPRGDLSFVGHPETVPFDIRRVYWVYDMPAQGERYGRALRTTHEFIIPLSGAFDVMVETPAGKRVFRLDRSYRGLYVPAGVWRSLDNFVTNSTAVVLASELFDENDYIRNKEEYQCQ